MMKSPEALQRPDLAVTRPDLAVTRVRRAIKLRLGRVTQVTALSPTLTRITLAGDDFRDFESASFDDHVKVFFPAPGEEKPVMPTLGPDGPSGDPAALRRRMRDFTPRRFNQRLGELDLEFALHADGVATMWARDARVGQYLGIGGPKGSMIIPTAFDWHLLIGDETALPAIARRLEELPAGVRALVVAEVSGPQAEIELTSRAALQVTWCHRGDAVASGLPAALRTLPPLPAGEGYVWAAAESSVVRSLREQIVSVRGIEPSRVRAAAYWKRGEEAVHEVIGD
jgi:NADPH-dependent ferric siderophore reductase